MYDRAFAASSEARVMVEAFNAKLDHSQSSMMAKIKNDCRNLAILLAGHGETCKSLFENHDAHARQLMLEHLNVPR
jgi:DNA-binding FadR family transcriptional regulator